MYSIADCRSVAIRALIGLTLRCSLCSAPLFRSAIASTLVRRLHIAALLGSALFSPLWHHPPPNSTAHSCYTARKCAGASFTALVGAARYLASPPLRRCRSLVSVPPIVVSPLGLCGGFTYGGFTRPLLSSGSCALASRFTKLVHPAAPAVVRLLTRLLLACAPRSFLAAVLGRLFFFRSLSPAPSALFFARKKTKKHGCGALCSSMRIVQPILKRSYISFV